MICEVLSRNGDGRYGFINTPEEASTQFASQLRAALPCGGLGREVQVEFNPNRVTAYARLAMRSISSPSNSSATNTVDAAELASAGSRHALYVVEVNPRGEGPRDRPRRYKSPRHDRLPRTRMAGAYQGARSPGTGSPAMRLAATTSAFSEWLASSPYAPKSRPITCSVLTGVPEIYGADARPKKLEWMIRQAQEHRRK